MATPVPATNTLNVGVALAATDVVTLADGGARQAPVAGTVSQTKRLTGTGTLPVSATTVTVPAAPTLTVATANAPVPVRPGMFTMPFCLGVAASATMSGPGFVDAESRNVLTPEMTTAGFVFVHLKLSCTSVGAIGTRGVNAKTYVCSWCAGIDTGVLGVPVTALVCGLVVW